MQFTTAVIALFGASALAAPAVKRQETVSFQIKEFTVRKLDGYETEDVNFHIASVDGGEIDFECGQYDFTKGTKVEKFVQDQIFSCAEKSAFSWSYTSGDSVAGKPGILHLWQMASDTYSYYGQASFAEPAGGACRSGGKGDPDQICTIPADTKIVIDLKSNKE
ncbi:major allergen alt a1 [Teratosphaeria destructans]|uniref:Major allergen alt a1 n=1 Tax=Teratosphaeria destructans TaxID=418781 RepID=A0A9W7SQ57_9PEZI|nr:major allergen alt a1 [Teratosphaeria destructans]